MRSVISKFSAALAALSVALFPLAANAQFPGSNGVIYIVAKDAAGTGQSLYSINPDGTGPFSIVAAFTSALSLAVSKDGTKLAYDAGGNIHTVNADGTGDLAVISTGTAHNPAFSPDGTKLFYDSANSIFTSSVDGTSQTSVLAAAGTVTYTSPVVSPDGLTLAFNESDSATNISNIFTSTIAGASPTNVTSNVAGTNSFSADFSPDGTRLAFNTFDATNFMTQTMPVAGGARVVAHTVANTTGTQTPGAPKYSPDGTSFASVTFTNGGGGGTSDVLVYLADGTGTPSNITSSNTLFGGSVLGTSAWSINALRVGLFGGGTGAPTLPDAGHTSSKAPIALAIVATLAVIGIEAGRRVRIRR